MIRTPRLERSHAARDVRSTPSGSGSWLRSLLDQTELHLELEDLRGWDPYDALCSPIFRLPILRSNRFARFGSQQLFKRLPWNLRPALRIEKQLNPVTIALYLQGQTYRSVADHTDSAMRRQKVAKAVERLRATASPGYSGACWGYPFDWEARYASISAGVPTVVATGMVTNSLWVAHSHFSLVSASELILDAARFVTNDLNRSETPDGMFCWSYSPLDRQTVLNATLKGSRLLAQARCLGGSDDLLDLAARSVRFVLSHQRPTGAWPYSVGDTRTWADNFHTGYVLECLNAYRRSSGDHTVDAALEMGWHYYRRSFLTANMVPKYYDNHVDPLDATACAQAIITLCEFDDLDAAEGAARQAISALALPDGSFAYQRRHGRIRRTPFLRWSTAWMYCALSRLEATLSSAALDGTRVSLALPRSRA